MLGKTGRTAPSWTRFFHAGADRSLKKGQQLVPDWEPFRWDRLLIGDGTGVILSLSLLDFDHVIDNGANVKWLNLFF